MMHIKSHREEIIERIKKTVPFYTPEWVFDETGGDLGSAFALTFADMFADTLDRYDKLFYKNYVEFLKSTGIEPIGCQAANGCVVFQLAQGAPSGCLVEEGTVLYDESGDVAYVTENPVYVTPALIKEIYFTSRAADEIIMLFGENEGIDNLLCNLQKHEMYICHGFAFDVGSSAEITVRFINADAGALCGGCVEWSYYSGDWEPFASVRYETDKIIFLLKDGKPFVLTRLFERDGFYIRCCVSDIKELDGFSADVAEVGVSSASVSTFKIYHGDVQLDCQSVYPFGKNLSLYDDFYIECREAFGKKGALVEISFDIISCRQDMINYVPNPPVQWKHIMPKSKLKEPEVYDTEIKEVSIDYWNGMDFVKLKTNENISDIFKPYGSVTPASISFICPDDMEMAVINGCESKWLRIRTLEISNLYKNNSHNIVPLITNINIGYKYLNSLKPVIYTDNNIVKEEFFTGKPFKQMEHLNTCIFFGLDRPPDGSPVGILYDVEPNIAEAGEISWYISGINKWERLLVDDHTDNLNKSGVITLFMDEQPMKKSIFGRELYWIKAEYNSDHIIRNAFGKIYLNAVPIIQDTQVSDGERGNLPAGSITKMHMSLGYISKVYNPLPVTGGRGTESSEHMLRRGADSLVHRQRAVTARDFEALAYKSTGNIFKCKCITDGSSVSIIYLPDDYCVDKRAVNYTGEKIISFLSAAAAPFLKITASEPVYIEIRIKAKIKINSERLIKTKDELEECLKAFLNPVTGNFKGNGFDIGAVPDTNYIQGYLKSLSTVDYIKTFSVGAYQVFEGVRQEIDFNKIKNADRAVPISGQHSITCFNSLTGE